MTRLKRANNCHSLAVYVGFALVVFATNSNSVFAHNTNNLQNHSGLPYGCKASEPMVDKDWPKTGGINFSYPARTPNKNYATFYSEAINGVSEWKDDKYHGETFEHEVREDHLKFSAGYGAELVRIVLVPDADWHKRFWGTDANGQVITKTVNGVQYKKVASGNQALAAYSKSLAALDHTLAHNDGLPEKGKATSYEYKRKFVITIGKPMGAIDVGGVLRNGPLKTDVVANFYGSGRKGEIYAGSRVYGLDSNKLTNPFRQHLVNTWKALANKYRCKENVVGYDLFNEPHGDMDTFKFKRVSSTSDTSKNKFTEFEYDSAMPGRKSRQVWNNDILPELIKAVTFKNGYKHFRDNKTYLIVEPALYKNWIDTYGDFDPRKHILDKFERLNVDTIIAKYGDQTPDSVPTLDFDLKTHIADRIRLSFHTYFPYNFTSPAGGQLMGTRPKDDGKKRLWKKANNTDSRYTEWDATFAGWDAYGNPISTNGVSGLARYQSDATNKEAAFFRFCRDKNKQICINKHLLNKTVLEQRLNIFDAIHTKFEADNEAYQYSKYTAGNNIQLKTLKFLPKVFVGEFGMARWSPGSGAYTADSIRYFESKGWDWALHAFGSWNPYNPAYKPHENPFSGMGTVNIRIDGKEVKPPYGAPYNYCTGRLVKNSEDGLGHGQELGAIEYKEYPILNVLRMTFPEKNETPSTTIFSSLKIIGEDGGVVCDCASTPDVLSSKCVVE